MARFLVSFLVVHLGLLSNLLHARNLLMKNGEH
jgi:hypothetical protein